MSHRFVSAGTADEPPERDADWLAAQQALDASAQQRREAEAAKGSGFQDGGRTLFEVLQANKASKQEAFEESAKLKNQFRSLDEDEIDFLDQVMESTRRKEQDVKRDTTQQLEAFRRQREEAERAAATEENEGTLPEADVWKAGSRKRRKEKTAGKDGLKGVKLRRLSSTAKMPEKSSMKNGKEPVAYASQGVDEKPKSEVALAEKANAGTTAASAQTHSATHMPPESQPSPPAGLGLADYGSDDE